MTGQVDISNMDRLITIDQATELLGVSRQTIYRMIERGNLQARHIGRSSRVVLSSVERIIRGEVKAA